VRGNDGGDDVAALIRRAKALDQGAFTALYLLPFVGTALPSVMR